MKSTPFIRPRAWCRGLAILSVLAFASVSAQAQVIYQQVFGNSSGSYVTLASQGIDWKSYFTTWNWNPGAGWVGLGLNPGTGLTTTSANIGAALPTTPTSLTNGMYTTSSGGSNQISLYTDALTLDPTSYSGLQFSWYQQALTDYTRVLVRVAGTWYLSADKFYAPTLTQQTFTYTTDAASWLVLGTGTNPYNANVQTLTTTASSNLSGSITAFGLYMDTASANWNSVDTFAVTAIPEPTTTLLLGVCATGWIGLALRRKSHVS